MNKLKYLRIAILVPALLLACERDRDFSGEFPSRAILGEGPYDGEYWPTDAWRTCRPEEVGMDSELLRMMNEDMVLQQRLHIDVHSVHVIRKGYIVAEQYYNPDFGPDSLHRVYSCTKSVTSAAFGIASDMGLMPGLDTPLLNFFDEYEVASPYGKDLITLRHALTMSDGFEWNELQYPYGHDLNTFTQWRRGGGEIQFILDQPLINEAGTSFNYNSGISHLLSVVIQEQTGMRLDSFVRETIFDPLGISNFHWSLNEDGATRGYSGLSLRPLDLAKFGYLYLKEGRWDQQQIVPPTWVKESTGKHILRGDIQDFYYGYQWWVRKDGLIAAVGYGGQMLMIIPGEELVVVFTNDHNQEDNFQREIPWRILDTFILPSIID